MINLPERPLDRIRGRTEEIRRKLEQREVLKPMKKSGASGIAPARISIGEGGLIQTGKQVADRVSQKAKELRPGFVPAVSEAVERFEPGSRLENITAGVGKRTAGVGASEVERPKRAKTGGAAGVR